MKLTKKSVLAIESMVLIKAADKPISVKTLSEARHTTPKYLEQVIASLRQNDLIQATSGKNGGYSCVRDDINCKDIIIAIEYEIKPVHCIDEVCPRKQSCYTYPLWCSLQQVIYDSLANVSLLELVTAYRKGAFDEINYQI